MSTPNGAAPACPVPPDFISHSGDISRAIAFGLTKREMFAAMAMQGILSNAGLLDTCVGWAVEKKTTPESVVASRSVKFADGLLSELEKSK